MKKLGSALFVSLLVVGCGGDSKPPIGGGGDGQDSGSGRNPSMLPDGGLTIEGDAGMFTDSGSIVIGDNSIAIDFAFPIEDVNNPSVASVSGNFAPNVSVTVAADMMGKFDDVVLVTAATNTASSREAIAVYPSATATP